MAWVTVWTVVVLAAGLAPAEAQYRTITDFGDSYADTGFAPGGVLRLPPGNFPCPAGPPQLPTCRFSGGTNFVDSLQAIYRLPLATNYAFGGARTDTTNSIAGGLPGFVQEIDAFIASGTRFNDRDLVVLSIGGNDSSELLSANTIPEIQAAAAVTAQNALAGVDQLIARGARNIAWVSPGNSFFFPSPAGQPLSFDQHVAWADAYFLDVQRDFAPAAHAGVRIFFLDFATLQARIAADPGQYGFLHSTGCQAALGVPGCLAASPAVQNSYFYFNTVHPTSAGMALIATYLANQMDATLTVVPQGSIAIGIAGDFVTSVLGRLDAERSIAETGVGAPRAVAMVSGMESRALGPAGGESRWSIYGHVEYAHGSRDRQPFAAGYDYDAVGGTVGIEYRPDPRLRLGGVFGYGAPDIDLDVQSAHDHVDAYQAAGYASFTDAHWFADGLVAVGYQDHALDRRGVLDIVRGGTHAETASVAARGGYLFAMGPLRLGPVAGLDYTHAAIDGYTETGDQLVTQTVARQSLDALTGDAGVQLRAPCEIGGIPLSPYLDLTAAHDFLGSGRTVTTTQVTTPLLPVLTPVPSTNAIYGKIAAGVAAAITERVTATATVATSFARAGGNDLALSGGIKLAF